MLYFWQNTPRYVLYKRLGGMQSQSVLGGKEKNSYSCPEVNPHHWYFTDRVIYEEQL
jgi:hypothetical protein